jgi:hypothetical protein
MRITKRAALIATAAGERHAGEEGGETSGAGCAT